MIYMRRDNTEKHLAEFIEVRDNYWRNLSYEDWHPVWNKERLHKNYEKTDLSEEEAKLIMAL